MSIVCSTCPLDFHHLPSVNSVPLSPLHKGTIVSAPSPLLFEALHVTCLHVVLGRYSTMFTNSITFVQVQRSQSHLLQSLQWITSIRSLLLHLTVLTSSPLLSVLLLWLVRRLWTDTIRRPITQMSTRSPWIRLSFFAVVIANTLLVLHPHHKLVYFEKQNWEDLWIQDAHEIVHHIFDDSYAPVAIWSQKDNVRAPNSIVSHTSPPFDFIVDPFQPKNIFNDLPDLAPMSSELDDELDHYLAADIEDTKDPLMWWYKHRGAFSNLSHMACDYLSIPGKSTNFSTCYKLFTLSSHYIRHWTGFQPRTACPFPYP